jgi:hypothetical protein|tara:strand:+ start:1465 stop:2031 length:567 start_codon:yes stop_codon:yes gene_type:complete
MRSPTDFIVTPIDGRRYANTKDIGGVELIISSSDEDADAANRFGEVIALPIGYTGPIEIGHTLLVHHNVFKFYNDMKGEQRSGRSYFRDDLFFIDDMQYYMYNDGDAWHTVDKYSFLSPIENKRDGLLYMASEEMPLMGKMEYPSEFMLGSGVCVGDTVLYQPELNSTFYLGEQKLYRLMDAHITVKL